MVSLRLRRKFHLPYGGIKVVVSHGHSPSTPKNPPYQISHLFTFFTLSIPTFHNFFYIPSFLTIHSAPFLWKLSLPSPKTPPNPPGFSPDSSLMLLKHPFPPPSYSIQPHTWNILLPFYYTPISTDPSWNNDTLPRKLQNMLFFAICGWTNSENMSFSPFIPCPLIASTWHHTRCDHHIISHPACQVRPSIDAPIPRNLHFIDFPVFAPDSPNGLCGGVWAQLRAECVQMCVNIYDSQCPYQLGLGRSWAGAIGGFSISFAISFIFVSIQIFCFASHFLCLSYSTPLMGATPLKCYD